MHRGRLEAFSDGVLAFTTRWVSLGLYVLVAVMWFIPDRRMERHHPKLEH